MKRGIWRCWRCKRHWVYNVEDRVESLDKICHGCGRRNRATIWRKPGRRGRHQKALVMCRPSYMPLHALQQEARRRNDAMGRPRKFEGFKQASKLDTDPVGRMFEVKKDE